MKKFCFVLITFLFMLIMVGCETTTTTGKYLVTVVNGVIKDENVNIKEVEPLDILTVIPSGDLESFAGWYVDNELVSSNAEYVFQVESDIELVAKFDGGSELGLKNGYYI